MQQEAAELFTKAMLAMQIRIIVDLGREVEVRFCETGHRHTLNIDGNGLPVFTELFREHLKAVLKPTPKERADALRELGRMWSNEYKSNASLFTKAVTLLGARWIPWEGTENRAGELCMVSGCYAMKVNAIGDPVLTEPIREHLLKAIVAYGEAKSSRGTGECVR